MELTILDYVGLPEGSILSVRSGPTRRQSPLPCSAPFRLPPGPWPLRIDVLGLLGKTANHAVLGDVLQDGVCKMPLEGKDGRQMSVTFQIGGSRSQSFGRGVKRDAEADARAYLDTHRLHEFMHGLFELLLRERPEDPYAFMAKRFSQAASMEAAALKAGKFLSRRLRFFGSPSQISQSSVSTATPSSASMMSSMSPSRDSLLTAMESFGEVPEGSYKAIFHSMRGRDVARLVVSPDEKVGSIKARLESSTAAPVSAIQLFWLGEMLPNDTTLEDWFVEAGPVVLHVVLSFREPKLQHILTGASEGGMRLWNPADAEQLKELPLSVSSAILAMCVDWKTMRVLCATFDGRMQLWDICKCECISSIVAHSEEVCCLDVDWENQQALSGSTDGSVKLWCLEAFRCTGIINTNATVDSLAVNWSQKRSYIGLRTGVVRFWDLASQATRDLEGGATAARDGGTSVAGMAIDAVGQRAVSGLEDGHLVYWHFEEAQGDGAEISQPQSPKVLLAHFSALRSIVAQWKEHGSRTLVGSDDGSLSLWRLDSCECLARFARHVGFVWAIHADWAKERCVSGAFDGCVKIWDLRSGECLRTIQGHSRPIRSICCGGSNDTLPTVKRLKLVLDNSSTTSKEEVLSALDQLQSLGSLPTEVLKETLVGKSVHNLAKSVEDPEIRTKAKNLELAWRQDFKKRKASTDDLQLRRCNSNVSEGTSPGLSLASRSFSQDLEAEPAAGSEARPLERATSSVSVASATSTQGDAKKDDYRDKVRVKLMEALGKDEEELEARGGETCGSTRDPMKLAEEIEEELAKALPKKEAYMNQARSILFNLKDSKNPTFKFKIMVGFFKASQLPLLTAEDMASEQKNDERRKQRKYAMEALDQGWALKNGQQPTTGMFTCGKCKGNKTTYFQMQTRSSDEPMTTFVTCLTCNNRWKFC